MAHAADRGDRAIALLQRAAAREPANHHVLALLARQLDHRAATGTRDDWVATASAWRRAAEQAPGFATYWHELGRALRRGASQREDYEAARHAFERCVAADPHLAPCHLEQATTMLWLDDEGAALNGYGEAIRRDPTQLSPFVALADLYLRLDADDQAEAVLTEAKRFARPDDPLRFAVHVLHAKLFQQHGELQRTIAELESARALAPDRIELLFNLGSTYAMLDPPRPAEAVEMLESFFEQACHNQRQKRFADQCGQAWTLLERLRRQ